MRRALVIAARTAVGIAVADRRGCVLPDCRLTQTVACHGDFDPQELVTRAKGGSR